LYGYERNDRLIESMFDSHRVLTAGEKVKISTLY